MLVLNEKDLSTLAASPLFKGVSSEEIPAIVEWLDGRVESYKEDELLFLIGDAVDYTGVVLSGSTQASFFDESFNNIGMGDFKPGSFFGEALACLEGSKSLVEMRAVGDCRVLFLYLGKALQHGALNTPYKTQFFVNLVKELSEKTLFLNRKLRIISQRKLRDRIRLYLKDALHDKDTVVNLPFGLTRWAEYLGANRSSFSRELSALKQEGVLVVEGRRVRILDPRFLAHE